MRFLAEAWDRIWFRRFDPLSAGVFRIFLGTLLTVFYVAHYPTWERYYAADGMVSLTGADPSRSYQSWWNLFFWTEGVLPVRVFWWVGFLAAVGFTLGLMTRGCTVLLFAVQTSMSFSAPILVTGEDLTFRMLLFFGCFAPLGHCLSLDRWLRSRRRSGAAPRPLPPVWSVRLLQVNIALIYVFSLPNKLVDDVAWRDGTAIYWTMLSGNWSRWPWPGVFAGVTGDILSALATYGTVLVEGAFPLLVWFPRTRPYVLAAATALHLGIAVFLRNVTFFTLAMVCSFWLFVPAETTRCWGTALARLVRRPAKTELNSC
jgi:hypothetical protein